MNKLVVTPEDIGSLLTEFVWNYGGDSTDIALNTARGLRLEGSEFAVRLAVDLEKWAGRQRARKARK